MPILTPIISESVKEPYYLFMFRHENAHVIIPHKSSENVTYFKSSGKTLKNQNCIQEEIQITLHSYNTFCDSHTPHAI